MNTCSTPNLYRVVLAHSLASAGFAVYSIVFASNPIAAAIALGAAVTSHLMRVVGGKRGNFLQQMFCTKPEFGEWMSY